MTTNHTPSAKLRNIQRPLSRKTRRPLTASIIRLIGAVLLENNDEWQLQHRYMQVEAMAELVTPANEAAAEQIAAAA